MQRTSEAIHDDQKGSANAVPEGSTSMTIEYLRVRLLSERSVTKATRERANELAQRVVELEEQLKIKSLQRKKAEKALLDALALLENHGIADVSDEYDSDSGMEESLYEPNMENVISKGRDGASGSEHESTPSTGRSLSWKSSKDSARSCEGKCFHSSPRKRSNFIQSASSSRHRLGKSCRQIKRREVRPIVEESRHESRSPDANGNIDDHSIHIINNLDSRSENLRKCSENNAEKTLLNEQSSVSSEVGQLSEGSVFYQKHTSDGEMERVLQDQAHLIGRYAAEEKAQREWEEKYMGNGCSMPDSGEPGNQSDVTEERDVPEERPQTQALALAPMKILASNSNSHKSEEPVSFTKGSPIIHVDSFKFSPNPVFESSRNSKVKEVHSSRTSADFAFPAVNETNLLRDNHITNSPSQSSQSRPPHHSPYVGSGYHQAETTPRSRNENYAIVPHEGPQKLGGVLDALQQAKELLGRNISALPSKEVISESSVSATKDAEIAKLAVGTAGLFRVPTDFQFQASSPQTTELTSDYPSHLNNYPYHSSLPLSGFDQNLLYSMETRPSSSNLDPFFTAYSPNATYPDMNRRASSSESSYIVQSPSRTNGLPPTGQPLFYSDHIRPNMYR